MMLTLDEHVTVLRACDTVLQNGCTPPYLQELSSLLVDQRTPSGVASTGQSDVSVNMDNLGVILAHS
jgi:hypothetical protein